MLKKHRSL